MNIYLSGSLRSHELICWNQNGDNNRWVPANEIVIFALAPPTTGEPGSS